MATGSSTEKQSFSKFVSLDVEEAGKEHFTDERVFFQIQIVYFVFWVNRNFSLSLLEFWKDSSTLQIAQISGDTDSPHANKAIALRSNLALGYWVRDG